MNWVLYGYVPKTDKIKVDKSGNGGFSEMTDEMSDGKVHYGFIRYNLNGTFKFVYIAWCGEGVTGIRKGSFATHAVDMGRFLEGFHVQINARSEEDLDETKILARLKTATSSHGRRNEKAKVQGTTGVDTQPAKQPVKRDVGADLKAESDAFWEKQRAEEAEAKRQREEEGQRNRNAPQATARNVGRAWEQKQQDAPAPQTRQAPAPSGGGTAKLASAFNNPPAQAPPPKATAPPPKAAVPPPKPVVQAEPDWGASAPQEEEPQGGYEEEAPREEEGGYDAPPPVEESYGGGGGDEQGYDAGGGGDAEESYGGGEEASGGAGDAPPASGGIECRALYAYQGENEGDLTFAEGDVIMVIDQSNPDGWWEGELNGVTGFFPSNFVAQV